MPIAFVNASQSTATGTNILTYFGTLTGDNLIAVVGASVESGDLITGITYNGVAMSLGTKQTNNSNETAYLFNLANPATGSQNIVVSTSANTDIRSASVGYSGARQTGQPDATTSGSVTAGTSISGTITTGADNSWIIGYANDSGVGAPVAGAGVTSRAATGFSRIGDSNAAITPAGLGTMTFTQASAVDLSLVMESIAPFVETTGGYLGGKYY